jgi:hypothetical protein
MRPHAEWSASSPCLNSCQFSEVANMFAMRTAVLALVMCPGAWPAMQPFGTHSQSQRNVSVTMVELPAPTGPFSIGTKIYNWVDFPRELCKGCGKRGGRSRKNGSRPEVGASGGIRNGTRRQEDSCEVGVARYARSIPQ